jgi:DNA-directed RNA polymerase subunit B'
MKTEVFLNGKFAGHVEDAPGFLTAMREQRRKGQLSHLVNVRHDREANSVIIESGRGRCRRPVIVVKDGAPLLTDKHIKQLERNQITWQDLVDQGVVEYLDAMEEEDCLIAFTPQELTQEHTHLEVSPVMMIGLVAALVPYANHMASSRIIIGAKNLRQSVGFYATNYPVRMDMDVNLLQTPQKPIVTTSLHDIGDYDKHPSGQNIVVAVMSWRGYNMEDAVVINEGSLQRGFGRSSYYRPAQAEELRYSGGLMDEITIPDKETKGYKSEKDYRMLEGDGIIFPEAVVGTDDVLIGKTSPPRFLSSLEEYSLASNVRRESSVALRHGEKGIVDFVLLTENEEGNKLVQVRIRENRVPEIGDKFTSRHGQKGVVGLVVPEADMPFTSKGVRPDLVFSPHGIPSRMTISHLLELVGGKVGALAGRQIDATIFESESEQSLRKALASLGFRENGVEAMYNGETGEMLQARIFIGNMYYLRLKHMVANKIHSRARGPIQLLTRQPTEGRAKEGGLRLGEMEKDTFVAHGASLLLKERFDSDKTVVPVCQTCGIIAIHDPYKNKRYCPTCGDHSEVNDIEIAYAFKLMLDEFKAMGIYPKLVLRSKY